MEGLNNNTSKRLRYFCFSFFIYVLVILASARTIAANHSKQKPSGSTSAKRKLSGPYCGLYCLYTAIRLTGQEANFQELLKPEYIGSRKGSSLAELKRAAEDYGLYAVSVAKLSSRVLRNCPRQVILHVKSELMNREYDHYELFLGTENGKAKIFNPPEPVNLIAFAELAPRWDGNGLIVSAEPIDLGTIVGPARKLFITYAAIAVAIILIVRWAKRWLPERILNSRRKLLGLSAAQGATLVIAALLCGMMYHFANGEGLLANANGTASIKQAHLGNFVPKISEKKVHKLLDTGTVFIDARLARDYKAGHLEGAISVPVDGRHFASRSFLPTVPR